MIGNCSLRATKYDKLLLEFEQKTDPQDMSLGGQPQRPIAEQSPVAPANDVDRLRRHLCIGMGVAAADAVLFDGIPRLIDYATREAYPDGIATISTAPGSRKGREPDTEVIKSPWITFGGLGRQRNEELGEIVANTALDVKRNVAVVGALNHPNQGISFPDNASLMERYTDGSAGMCIVGHSMGLLTAMESAYYMDKPRHIDAIVAVSSPTGIDDVYRAEEVKFVVRSGFRGDLVQKFAFQLVIDHNSDRRGFFGKLGDVVDRAARGTFQGISPRVYCDQLDIVCNMDLASQFLKLAGRGMITPKTKILYAMASDDRTVRAVQACSNCAAAAKLVDAQFSSIEFDGSHADMQKASTASAGWCRRQITL